MATCARRLLHFCHKLSPWHLIWCTRHTEWRRAHIPAQSGTLRADSYVCWRNPPTHSHATATATGALHDEQLQAAQSVMRIYVHTDESGNARTVVFVAPDQWLLRSVATWRVGAWKAKKRRCQIKLARLYQPRLKCAVWSGQHHSCPPCPGLTQRRCPKLPMRPKQLELGRAAVDTHKAHCELECAQECGRDSVGARRSCDVGGVTRGGSRKRVACQPAWPRARRREACPLATLMLSVAPCRLCPLH